VVEVTTVSLVSPSQANALLTASGYVVAQRKAAIASKATGRLVYLGYEEGDKVKKGEIIARIESADVNAALAQAKANLELNQAQKVDAERSLERANKLFVGKLISQAELDAAQMRYDQVVAGIAVSKAGLNAAEVQVENTLIRAPFDGTILTKNADVGEVVSPFSAGATSRVAVVTIADMTSLEVEADVSESNIEKITFKQPCEITLDAYPEQRYRGYVNKIVPTADRSKATVMTKIRFVDKDNRVLPEMSAKVNFLSAPITDIAQAQPKLTVAASAVTNRNGKNVVFLFTGNEVSEVPVELGEKMGSMFEIKSGLSSGDKVAVKPSEALRSGTKVKLKE
jgi:HlyD family secretion protein